jgi:hypothetical protein
MLRVTSNLSWQSSELNQIELTRLSCIFPKIDILQQAACFLHALPLNTAHKCPKPLSFGADLRGIIDRKLSFDSAEFILLLLPLSAFTKLLEQKAVVMAKS